MQQHIFLLFTALQLGFLGSVHCIGMCGGFICAICHGSNHCSNNKLSRNRLQISYHVGRILTYTLYGVLVGSVGMMFSQLINPEFQTFIRMAASFLVILSGLSIAGMLSYNKWLESSAVRYWQPVKRWSSSFFPVNSYPRAIAVGILWGMLPCGLLYTALIIAMGAGDIVWSGLVMFVFALGTLPGLLAFGMLFNVYHSLFKSKVFYILSGALVTIFGMISLGMTSYHLFLRQTAHVCH